jgi:hypothetical protein
MYCHSVNGGHTLACSALAQDGGQHQMQVPIPPDAPYWKRVRAEAPSSNPKTLQEQLRELAETKVFNNKTFSYARQAMRLAANRLDMHAMETDRIVKVVGVSREALGLPTQVETQTPHSTVGHCTCLPAMLNPTGCKAETCPVAIEMRRAQKTSTERPAAPQKGE